jgi:NAD(P)-dependent dehydrogenase (short-subunit alcohol dehydrogenase family)
MPDQARVAIVTGGANGIGRAACREFSAAGLSVVVVDVDANAARDSCEAVRAAGAKAIWVEADVSQSVDVQRYVAAALDAYGRIDVLFNNAGIPGAQTPLVDYPQDVFERVLQVNLMGTFLGMKHVLPTMIAQGRGAIVNMASVSGTVGAPTMAAYSASKHAVIGLTRTVAGEVGRQGIRVNAVCPGPIETALIDTLHAGINPQDPAAVKAFNVGRNPMGRYGEAQEVARLVVFLASDAASYVNGAAWLIDGGRTAV